MNKSILFTFELEPGMITAEDVYTVTGQLLIPERTLLDNSSIHKLKLYNVSTVAIIDSPEEPSVQDTTPTYSERIQDSMEFQEFKADYLENIDEFHDTINDIVTKNAPIQPEELLVHAAGLIDSSQTTYHLFDMLHNMREFDDSTFTHSLNVALICRVFGKWLHMPEDDLDVLTLSGLLHDIGKLTTPGEILTKPGRLTTAEYQVMKDHVKNGYAYLKNQPIDPRIKEACLFHHERCDGSGYPFGLSGNKIPEFARIVSIADVYDAMTAKRVYRGPICPFKVIKFIEDEGYNKYDPRFLLTFLENVVATYIHTTVRLNSGQCGEVVLINKNALSRPMLQCDNEFIDLSKHPELSIEQII